MGGHEVRESRKSGSHKSHGGMERRRLGCAAVGTTQARSVTLRRDVLGRGARGHVVKMERVRARGCLRWPHGVCDRCGEGVSDGSCASLSRDDRELLSTPAPADQSRKGWLGWERKALPRIENQPVGGQGMEASGPPAGGKAARPEAPRRRSGLVRESSASERGGGVQLAAPWTAAIPSKRTGPFTVRLYLRGMKMRTQSQTTAIFSVGR